MQQRFLDLYHDVKKEYGKLLLEMRDIRENITSDNNLNECADQVYALRETIKVMEEALKEAKKVFSFAQQTACLVSMEGNQDFASTPHCRGEAEVKQILKVPGKRRYDVKNFDALMEYLGVPVELYRREEGEEELIRPHWPEVQKKLNNDLAEGKSVPIEQTEANEFIFKTRKRKAL